MSGKKRFFALSTLLVIVLLLSGALQFFTGLGSGGEAYASGEIGWYPQVSGTHSQLNAVSACNESDAWIAGADNILKTEDGGLNWVTAKSNGARDICAVTPEMVWALGWAGEIYRTTDGGQNWIETTGDTDFMKIYAVDTDTAWVVGGNGLVMRTIDAGVTWQDKSTFSVGSTVQGITAIDADVAWAVCYDGTIMKTINGGTSWDVKTAKSGLYSVDAFDENNVWASGYVLMAKTSNGGSTWYEAYESTGYWNHIGVSGASATIAWTVTMEGDVLKSIDNGVTWFPQETGTTTALNSVSAVNENVAWIVGNGGLILHTIDGGGYQAPPNISAILPSSGRIGSEVKLTGTDFGTSRINSYVSFNGVQASDYTSWSDTEIKVVVPDGVSGEVKITIVNPGGISNEMTFYVIIPTISTYYFAEGCTRDSFSEWLCIQNPSDQEVLVSATYMLFGGPPKDAVYPIPANSRVSVSVNNEVGPGQDVSVKLWGEGEFYPERPMYFNYKEGSVGFAWDGGHVSTGAVAPDYDWYFAEGCTREGFEEWLCIQNPNDRRVDIRVDYITADAYVQSKNYVADANSRISVFVNGDVGPGQDVSVHIHCGDPIVAERPMYFNYHGEWTGGHVVMGTDSPKTIWYFAEGTTRTNFDEWLAVQNPNNQNAQLTVRFLKSDGSEQDENYTVGANSRWTLNVSGPLGLEVDSAMAVESSIPVVAERPMYFNYNGIWTGGHDVLGTSELKPTWYFPEGCTREGFDEYVCVANPGEEQAQVTFTFMLGAGDPIEYKASIAPHQRFTLAVPSVVERGQDVSTMVSSDKPVVAERSMYFIFNGVWTGGHDVVGYHP